MLPLQLVIEPETSVDVSKQVTWTFEDDANGFDRLNLSLRQVTIVNNFCRECILAFRPAASYLRTLFATYDASPSRCTVASIALHVAFAVVLTRITSHLTLVTK